MTGVSMDTGTAKRESQISIAFTRLDKTIDELNNVVIRQEESLEGVLRNNEAEKELRDNVEQREQQVTVAATLNNFDVRLQNTINKLNSMQRRLEL
jgi:hypothetical protein